MDKQKFIWTLSIKNEDTQSFPTGFGHHPYFVKPTGANAPHVQIPCKDYFELTDYMATDAAVPVTPEIDFQQMRALDNLEMNHVFTGRNGAEPARMKYPEWGSTLEMFSDPLFEHILLYAPAGQPFYAVEPMTNASDGFNLFADHISGSGVFVLQPGEENKQA